MDVLSSRVLIQPSDPAASRRFYRDQIGLAVYREFGDPASPTLVFFVGGAFLELSGTPGTPPRDVALWWQVRDVDAEHTRLTDNGVTITRAPRTEPWGLKEMWITDPDDIKIVLIEIPDEHPLRRDTRTI